MRVALFDSGIGGLTVLDEALSVLPGENYLFYADTLHVPYGSKPKEEVRRYIMECVDRIMQENVKALVVACNTATSIAISELRARYRIPVIGMEPAVKPAVALSRPHGKRVLVMATPLTLSQSKYTELVARVDDKGSVDSLPLPELVQYCEQLIWDREVIVDYFTTKLASFDLDQYGTVVLGCTHYPYYRKLLEEILPRHIHIIDGSEGTVKRLQSVLQENHLLGASTLSEIRYMCSSGDEQYVEKMQHALSFLRSRRGIPAGN